MSALALFCRSGYEKDCIAEIQDKVAQYDLSGYAKTTQDTGLVIFYFHDPEVVRQFLTDCHLDDCIFIRQWHSVMAEITIDPEHDRIQQLLPYITESCYQDVWVQSPEQELIAFCRKFTVPLRRYLKQKQIIHQEKLPYLPVLQCTFVNRTTLLLGYSLLNNQSPYPLGIPRLKFPTQAPSRSTLKLAEAFQYFLTEEQRSEWLRPGLTAVDLGASPGGWTYQLINHGLLVYAIDNGPIADNLLQNDLVEHRRMDGLSYRPEHKRVTWLVCDMIEKPQHIIELISRWLMQGWCQHVVANLKLPMKQKYQHSQQLLDLLQSKLNEQFPRLYLRAKHLYHDRAEITLFITIESLR